MDITFNKDGMEVTLERKNYRTVLGGKVFCPTPKQQLKMEEIPKELPMSMKGQDGRNYRLEEAVGGLLSVVVDGVLVKRVPYQDYLEGNIKLPKHYKEKAQKVGETAVKTTART